MLRTPWGDADSMRERKLPPGRGRERDEVRREQRERIFAALVANCARQGYEATSVADIVDLSGVSRGTFYQQFEDKLDCFLALEKTLLAVTVSSAGERLAGAGEGAARARAAFEVVLELLADQPAAARVCLVDSYIAGAAAVAPVRAATERIVGLAASAYEEIPGHAGMPVELTRAIVGGLRHVIFNRLREGREAELSGLVPDLWAWAMSYEAPPAPLRRAGRRGIVEIESPLPPFAAYSPEQRIIRAFAAVVAENGYAATGVPDIATAASISQTTFYQYFDDKADALIAALESSGAQLAAATLPPAKRAADWPAAVRIAMEASCGFLAAEPDFAHLRLVEVFSGGATAITTRDRDGAQILTTLLAAASDDLPNVPPLTVEATVGAIYAALQAEVVAGNVANLPEVSPLLTYVALAPMIGADEAARVAAESGPPRRD
jgi:AcrR family transcriptional regulator